jgi:hypothetical protein
MLGSLALDSGYGQDTVGHAKALAMSNALDLYQRSRNKALWGRVSSIFTRRTRSLLDLNKAKDACSIRSQCYGGTRAVPLIQIRGSEGRCNDFDRDFNPLQSHTRERWLSIAAARELGTSMPPVELVKVGDAYFVRDGHHRISVGRALGQRDIEAEVTILNVVGQLPWEREPAADPSTEQVGALELSPSLA